MARDPLEEFATRYWAFARRFPANLLGYRDEAAFRAEGIAPSAALAPAIPRGGALIDLGSGGGLPGLVFAFLRPDAAIHLLEPRHKRWVFLREAAAALSLANVTAHLGQWPGFAFPPATPPFAAVSIRALKLSAAMAEALRPRLAPDPVFLLFHADNLARVKTAGWRAVTPDSEPRGPELTGLTGFPE